MNIHLIPQPQVVQSRGQELVSGISGWTVRLALPVPDARITRLAEALFAGVQETAQPGSICALVLEGLPLNPVMAARVAGKHDGYVLAVDQGRLEVYAHSAPGLFYGLKTLEQLLLSGGGSVPALTIADWADLRLRSDYLDLRTVYPTYEHMLEYVAELSSYKINTLIIEYEDKLPFRQLAFLRHSEFAFTEEEHRLLLQTAHDNFVTVIPKQQSFGHLEYILKHPAYIGLRETPETVSELCPNRAGSYEMMAGILEEVAALHPESEYLHLGCDEVWSLGTCEDCRRSGLTREASFIRFVNLLAAKAVSLGKRPMIWHDMLMHAAPEELALLDKRVIVVVWLYGGHRMKADARAILHKLRDAGIETLGASSVRCWDDNGDQNYPVIHNRISNILGWTGLARSEQLEGIIGTNWACPFSLGSPYGLFETSRYPAFFSADQSWNFAADEGSYLERFLLQYHGLPAAELPPGVLEGWEDYTAADYYQLVPQLLPALKRNRLTAELIDVMLQYEIPAQRSFPLQTFLFRGVLSPDSEEVFTFMREKHKTGYGKLLAAKRNMEAVLAQLLPPRMAGLFLMSRFYRMELFEDNLRGMIKDLSVINQEGGDTHA
ncbi:glycoside hydrolase family 20 zincin-like fold domain-containing protein [Paenibacillus sp. S150]|uniref:glycoside hydrolase family 20 zincin-like fold domain-containing protein n=1 Tax=Paenibacillus sp. S150 TaxID=2749826 RepID=UPI001C559675|nr:glycoside hydrolase family 20 zincin-like fold domain-containing protein [Paenibacillus sp. S150]MBW4082254.1 family 20 glycosylhydrolase [Paenibacillus sp. S150]